MIDISLILGTARDDYALVGLPDTHTFEPTIRGLLKQGFTDFELIVIDELYPYRKDLFKDNVFQGKKLPFPVKHMSPKYTPNKEKRLWRISNGFNTGFIHAEGELIIMIDDCSEFLHTTALEKYWSWHQKGYLVGALFTFYLGGKQLYNDDEQRFRDAMKIRGYGWETNKEAILKLFKSGTPVRDTRWLLFGDEPVILDAMLEANYYNYSSISLDAALKVNGYDQLFDAGRGLPDCDLGSRLEMANYQYVLDSTLTVIEHWHKQINTREMIKTVAEITPFKSNSALYALNRLRKRFRANTIKLTAEDIAYIRRESVGKDYVTEESVKDPLFDWWVENQQLFDLRELRWSI